MDNIMGDHETHWLGSCDRICASFAPFAVRAYERKLLCFAQRLSNVSWDLRGYSKVNRTRYSEAIVQASAIRNASLPSQIAEKEALSCLAMSLLGYDSQLRLD